MLLIPLQPREFATGLALFCVVPTTLGVGVALTAASKGNQALALLLTVSAAYCGNREPCICQYACVVAQQRDAVVSQAA
jgi:hypothetical protein